MLTSIWETGVRPRRSSVAPSALAPTGRDSYDHRRNQAYCYVAAGLIPEYRRTSRFLAEFSAPVTRTRDPRTSCSAPACSTQRVGWTARSCCGSANKLPPTSTPPKPGPYSPAANFAAASSRKPTRRIPVRAITATGNRFTNLPVLAIIHCKQGRYGEARVIMEQLPTPAWFYKQQPENWQQQVLFATLRCEAEALIGLPLTPIQLGP